MKENRILDLEKDVFRSVFDRITELENSTIDEKVKKTRKFKKKLRDLVSLITETRKQRVSDNYKIMKLDSVELRVLTDTQDVISKGVSFKPFDFRSFWISDKLPLNECEYIISAFKWMHRIRIVST